MNRFRVEKALKTRRCHKCDEKILKNEACIVHSSAFENRKSNLCKSCADELLNEIYEEERGR